MRLNEHLYLEPEMKATRDGFGEGLVEVGRENKNVVVLTGDLKESTRVEKFAQEFPERFIECGVAEQNMLGVATGLALSGKIPYVSSFASFSPGNNWSQLRLGVCYSQANVKIASTHAGVSTGEDGVSHQALEDLAQVRVLPNIIVLVPCDALEAQKATLAAAKHPGPLYLRLGREKTPVITSLSTPFKIGRAEVFQEGKDVTIVACGSMVYEAMVAAKELEKEKIWSTVINCHTIKPLDIKTIVDLAKITGAVVTCEEHQIDGGLGSAVAEVLAEYYPVPVKRVGVEGVFGQSGKADELMKKFGLRSTNICQKVRGVLKEKK